MVAVGEVGEVKGEVKGEEEEDEEDEEEWLEERDIVELRCPWASSLHPCLLSSVLVYTVRSQGRIDSGGQPATDGQRDGRTIGAIGVPRQEQPYSVHVARFLTQTSKQRQLS